MKYRPSYSGCWTRLKDFPSPKPGPSQREDRPDVTPGAIGSPSRARDPHCVRVVLTSARSQHRWKYVPLRPQPDRSLIYLYVPYLSGITETSY